MPLTRAPPRPSICKVILFVLVLSPTREPTLHSAIRRARSSAGRDPPVTVGSDRCSAGRDRTLDTYCINFTGAGLHPFFPPPFSEFRNELAFQDSCAHHWHCCHRGLELKKYRICERATSTSSPMYSFADQALISMSMISA